MPAQSSSRQPPQGLCGAVVTASPSAEGGNLSQCFKTKAPAPEHLPGAPCDPEAGGPAPPAQRGWAVQGLSIPGWRGQVLFYGHLGFSLSQVSRDTFSLQESPSPKL